VFDLDPGEGVAWDFVIETAVKLRTMLKDEGLEPWPKLTGVKGLHLMAPIDRTMDHNGARVYAKRIAQRLAVTAPERYTLAAAPESAPGASSSTTCATAAAPRRSALGRRGCGRDSRSRPR
jgi:bifunctional non-homologous end joining protein LigD